MKQKGTDFWTAAPEWAQFWACHGNGEAFWYEVKPEPFTDDDDSKNGAWGYTHGRAKFDQHLPPPEDDFVNSLVARND